MTRPAAAPAPELPPAIVEAIEAADAVLSRYGDDRRFSFSFASREKCAAARAALVAAIAEALESCWRTIDSVPINSYVLVWNGKQQTVAKRYATDDYGKWSLAVGFAGGDDDYLAEEEPKPTHWQPLPEPPR